MNKELCNTWYFFQYLFELSWIMKNVLRYTSRRNMNRRSSKYEPQQFINFYLHFKLIFRNFWNSPELDFPSFLNTKHTRRCADFESIKSLCKFIVNCVHESRIPLTWYFLEFVLTHPLSSCNVHCISRIYEYLAPIQLRFLSTLLVILLLDCL